MSMDGIRVNHGELDRAAQDLMDGVKKIDERLNRLEDELKPKEADWDGNAKNQYITSRNEWENALKEMVVILGQTSATVSQANQNYADADKRGEDAFQGI